MGVTFAVKRPAAHVALLGLLALLGCDRTSGTSGGVSAEGAAAATAPPSSAPPAAPPVTSALSTASAAVAPPPANDGTDPKRPVLSPDDASFTDSRHGWGWSDRCFKQEHAGKHGWAMAACQKGLDLPDLDAKAKPALVYNQGLVAEGAGDKAGARAFYERSLALRAPDDSGRATVTTALIRVGGKPPADAPRTGPDVTCRPDEEKGVCFGMTNMSCCYKKCKKESDCPSGTTCAGSMCIPAG